MVFSCCQRAAEWASGHEFQACTQPIFALANVAGLARLASRPMKLGIRSVPAVAVNGKLADCCVGRGVNEEALRAAGIGQPLA